ncbi:anthranilate N-benzoyltransferase protein 1 [Panicum miliaceum]|uniref:Anthranilate N-benzoyltransferase protein 1 n=1 Tax=Panicum miliaceum TaxID=4540 RepID=A0A3L6Q2A0_PANMI|nr:anthranilate N-benzoyltransferase protein 1 [Panicum miliaceum]
MKVDVVGTTLVAPSEDTPHWELWLSNLDLAVCPRRTPLVYYYPASAPATGGAAATDTDGGAVFFAPERLEAALARALVPVLPAGGEAGSAGVGEGGRLQIDCNAEGALFVVATADFAGDDVFTDDYWPSPEVRRMFVPFAASGDPPCVMSMFQPGSHDGPPRLLAMMGRKEDHQQ